MFLYVYGGCGGVARARARRQRMGGMREFPFPSRAEEGRGSRALHCVQRARRRRRARVPTTDDGWRIISLFLFIHPSPVRSFGIGRSIASELMRARSGRPSRVGAPRDRSFVIHPSIHPSTRSPTLFSTRRRRPFSFYIPLRVVIIYPSGPRLFFTDWWFNPASSDVDDVRERCDVKLTDPL